MALRHSWASKENIKATLAKRSMVKWRAMRDLIALKITGSSPATEIKISSDASNALTAGFIKSTAKTKVELKTKNESIQKNNELSFKEKAEI